jgi:hypothetical protein
VTARRCSPARPAASPQPPRHRSGGKTYPHRTGLPASTLPLVDGVEPIGPPRVSTAPTVAPQAQPGFPGAGPPSPDTKLIMVAIWATFAAPFRRGRMHSVIGSKRKVIGALLITLSPPRGRARYGAGPGHMTGTTGPTPRAAVCLRQTAERQSGRSGRHGACAGSASTVASACCLAWRSVMVTRFDTRRQCRCGSA